MHSHASASYICRSSAILLLFILACEQDRRNRAQVAPSQGAPPQVASSKEWTQDGGNPQRTGYTPEQPDEPWTYLWSFNGPDSNGGTSSHFYNAPQEARTVTGGGQLYVPAGIHGLYALTLSNGSQGWRVHPAGVRFTSTPAYDTGNVYAGASDGHLYKIQATTGSVLATYAAGNSLNKAVLLVGSYAYVVTDSGGLHKVDTGSMSRVWMYPANSTVATPPSYSATRDAILYATDDLFVHAVNNSNGTQKWRVKPTPNSPGGNTLTNGGSPQGVQFERAWPVIADQSGVVLLRLQLDADSNFDGPNNGSFADTNAENRAWLEKNPTRKNLFALSLDDGSEKFVPAVGYGSVEDTVPEGGIYPVMGASPVVKTLPGGKEVAYMLFRNGQSNPPTDYRWSGHMGEMVLDDTTVPRLAAGDLRFVKMGRLHQYSDGSTGNSFIEIIDEQSPISMAGDTLIYAHWSASTGVRITDRSDPLGLTFDNPIRTSPLPPIIRAQRENVPDKNTSTHWTNGPAQYFTDGGDTGAGRFYGGPAFWVYWNTADPPGWLVNPSHSDTGESTGPGGANSTGCLPRYTSVSNGYMIVEGSGGEISVFRHSGG